MSFRCILIRKTESGQRAGLTRLDEEDLMAGDVTIDVSYSSVNYKDGLAITGKGPIVRRFPLIPGIDLAGTVRTSSHGKWKPGDQVVTYCKAGWVFWMMMEMMGLHMPGSSFVQPGLKLRQELTRAAVHRITQIGWNGSVLWNARGYDRWCNTRPFPLCLCGIARKGANRCVRHSHGCVE